MSRARKLANYGVFLIPNQREVLAKNANGSDMKNLPITSRPTIDRVRSFVCSQLPNSNSCRKIGLLESAKKPKLSRNTEMATKFNQRD